MIILVCVLIVLLITAGYVVINLLKKNEKCEDVINSYQKHILETNLEIESISVKLDKIDEKGTFKSDDEIGWFFNSIKGLRDKLLNIKLDL
jgi:hypothetical protein